MMSIDVETRAYSGPFDLLLQLILNEQVDIYEVDLAKIVDQYLVAIEDLGELDLDVATHFLLTAATLVELKARRLLPGPADMDLDDELALWEERDLLLARLLECKTFKDVSEVFSRLAEESDRCYARVAGPDERFEGVTPDLLAGVTPDRVMRAAIRALTPAPVPVVDLYHVAPIRLTVAEAVIELVDELGRSGPITFRRLTSAIVERIEVIVRFLAVLELFKQGYVDVTQAGRFGEITIEWVGPTESDGHQIQVDIYEG
jgi:segregation and condensation protein A